LFVTAPFGEGTVAVRAGNVGLGLAVLSAATFGTSGSFASGLMAAGWSPAAAVTARIGIAAVLLTVPAVLQLRGRWHLLRRSVPAVLGYGLVAVTGAQLFYFNAVEHLSVGVALLLEYSGTLLVVGWLWVRHAQRPRRRTVGGGVLALTGLALVLGVTGGVRVDGVGVLWGLAAATGLAVYFVLSARADDALPPLVMAWAGMAVGALTLGAAGLVGAVSLRASAADAELAGHRVSWLLPVLGLSLVAALLAYVAGIAAARRLGARLASFVGLAEVLFAVLFAWLLLGQRPGLLQAVGGLVVLAGIALVRADETAEPVATGVGAADLPAPPLPEPRERRKIASAA
jgi:drug/metabolite transporter (DMT)-like permease